MPKSTHLRAEKGPAMVNPPKWSRRAILTSGLANAGLACWGTARANATTESDILAVRVKLEKIGRFVDAETRAGRATGVSISVAEKGVIVWEGGFGWAHRATARRATAHTPFSLASITKTFTAAAVMRLVQAGRLELEAPIERYLRTPLPRSKFEPASVTLRRLGGHAAGLPSLFEMFTPPGTAKPLTELIRDYGELAYPAGERYEYANLGYSLLGAAVSHVTGRDFAAASRDLVIRPLGLQNTFFDTDAARMRAAAGRYDQNDHEIPFYTTATPPSGEVYASAHDLSIFAAAMMGITSGGHAPLLGPEALDALFSPVFTSRTQAFTTFGWSGRDVAGERVIVKTGGQPGVAARLTLLPLRQISIAVLANRDGNRDLVARVCAEIAASLIPGWRYPDFQMEEVARPLAGTHDDFDGSWTGSIRNGTLCEPVRILIEGAGESTCIVGNGGARPIRDLTSQSNTLMFNVDGGLAASAAGPDGTVRQLDFKLVARNGDLLGRCLSVLDRPGYTSTEPHIVTLSR
jgi:CubicO group peptidase (beta-lactamase class C family)